MDLTQSETRNRLRAAITAAAEGLTDILSRILAEHSDTSVGSETEPFLNENKLYKQTIRALAGQGFIHVFDYEKIPDSGQVLYLKFSPEFQPHPVFMTVKGFNVITNLNFKLGKINGLPYDPKKTAISVPGCLAVDGPHTSCALCRSHYSTQELGCRPDEESDAGSEDSVSSDGLALAPEDVICESSVLPVVPGTFSDGEPSSLTSEGTAVSSPDVSAGRMIDVKIGAPATVTALRERSPNIEGNP